MGLSLRAKRSTRQSAENISISALAARHKICVLGRFIATINNVIARAGRTFGACFIQRPLDGRQRIKEARECRNSQDRNIS